VTHSVDLAASLADESIILDHGLVVARGSIADGLATYAAMIGVAPPPIPATNVPAG
jgi:ABC-type molybdate transport system ATPase subunit